MKFQSLKEWTKLNESGKAAIPSSRSITWEEAQKVYDFVQRKIAPKFGIDASDMDVIGSYGKKRKGETHGDLDIAVSTKALGDRNGLGKEDLVDFVNDALVNSGFETKIMRGFKQVSAGIPIPGTSDIAQVDFMLSSDLEWSKFVYHSPNYREKESKYKGSVRNALLMAIITETSKNILKQTPEGDVEELESNVIRYPEGIYKSRRSWAGKKGLVKTPKLLKDFDELITTNPQEVVELVVGKGYDPNSIGTFESLWHLVTRDDFKHWDKLEDILKKFAGNLKAQGLPVPEEAKEMYPEFFSENVVRESVDYKEAMEDLADQEHDSWARWMEHLFKKSKKNADGTVIIPKDKVDRWERQMKTDYEDLSNKEKESDRKEVRKFVKILKKAEKNED